MLVVARKRRTDPAARGPISLLGHAFEVPTHQQCRMIGVKQT